MASSRKIVGKTPKGGVESEAYFLNEKGESVDESVATNVEIVERNEKGEEIARTYGTLGKTK